MLKDICVNKNYGNLVDGEWVTTQNSIEIYNPLNNSLLGTIPAMSQEDINKVLKSSKKAQTSWANTPVSERANILYKAANLLEENKEVLANILMNEICKDKKSCLSEVTRTATFIRFTADAAKHLEGEVIYADNFPGFEKNKISFVTRVPMGVILAISPFNYPINLSASKIAPALMGGNSIVLKPPTQGAISALHLCEIFSLAGVPKGVLNTVTGKGSEIGDYIVTHEDVDFINFTGSTEVGKHIAKIAGMVPLLMELGGKDAAIVLEDADLDRAVKEIVSGAYSYSGQRCTAIKRVLVMNSIADKFSEKLAKEVSKLKVGNPEETDVTITPLIDNSSADFVESLIKDALSKNAKQLVEYKRKNNLISPYLLDNVSLDMDIAWVEPFGPVLPIIRIDSIEEAINICNRSNYGLQSSIFTSNIDNAFYIASKLEVGTVQVNTKTERGPDHFPFSGIKDSGIGTQGIKYSIESMTRLKATNITMHNL
ncbi:nonphosphorylating glyceraldehyde-3-phosphate dehydrogenase [Clostridium collagenovorans DSM 3089]|uniref:Nonphosphorylating glyceraldehyde-3-phosphate dehydrogenase n=1 Tax=Clostridium collagenovorans DSM 3089 TaxID=1121306 RepID=A0A1M5VW23_9CLOT|nr:NADP-dependent glyceraldehyde-3-phosphate dehydrogenase [Clostridium collagenovorans]SHH79143.1 nonphosphorylating glyceraldehyde-3-phosphate dehydrogenase [Clostridium collagenovorans DSM 3089]